MDPAQFWSTGDYAVVGDLWSAPGRELAAALPARGHDVIDLATGTGATAIAAARHQARSVVGVDVARPLLEVARHRARTAGVDVTWLEADMASVPWPSGSADLVTSTFGLIFAAEPQVALTEARRLTRPGGRIVFTSWSGTGLFGRIRQTLAPYFPDAPEPWHETREDIVSVTGPDTKVTEQVFTMTVASPERFVDLMHRHSAPIIRGAHAMGDRWPRARAQLVDLVRAAGQENGSEFRIPVGYLVTTLEV
ncbi:class I SAM-dependent methyltransferase [Nocardiopsis metallicus]|uniref:SAM-dependent methyltransferase n=1 Tax=Nocardiopsis metallicus TaxID=179819 RepID=A0A840W426_9ACTN|nr:class I SAM-dependent methyltransferase [Nocardiopsis metallicus]MBB5490734.1 SAM-dependent methyltransferase [Nocardiopsis metallicus]